MKQHVNRIAVTCFLHLRRLRQVRRCIGRDLTVRLILAFITTWLDYCNSVLAGLPQTTLALLQRVQNAAARLIFELCGYEHVTPSLIQLYWLPGSVEDLLQAVPGVPEGNSTHCQQHNGTSWITLGSVNRLRCPTTAHEVRRTRVFLRRSSRVESLPAHVGEEMNFHRFKTS